MDNFTQALLVGGPLHGSLLALSDPMALTLAVNDSGGAEHVYIRRSSHAQLGTEISLFVEGRPTYEEVLDAIRRSSLSKTAKLRMIGDGRDEKPA